MLRRRPQRAGLIAGALSIVFFTSAAGVLSWNVARSENQRLAQRLAQEAVERTDAQRRFTLGIRSRLEGETSSAPCAPEKLMLFRALSYGSPMVADIGYVEDGRLMCSAYGLYGEGIPLPPPDYHSPSGSALRLQVRLPFSSDQLFLVTSAKNNGYAAIVPSRWTSGSLAGVLEPGVSIGVLHTLTGKHLFRLGTGEKQDLPTHPEQAASSGTSSSSVRQGLIAWSESSFGYVGYALIPDSQLWASWRRMAWAGMPAGLLLGLLVAYAGLWLARRQASLGHRIKQALENDEFFMVYQPVVDLVTGQWAGVEALIRWRTQDGQYVSPDLFIAEAEKSQLIKRITRRVMRLVMTDLTRLRAACSIAHVAFNVSGLDIRDPMFVDTFVSMAHEFGIEPSTFIVEVTERVLVDDQATLDSLRRLRDIGVRIAIDDFGTGYSSLSYLSRMHVDILKIDRSFIATIGTCARNEEVVRHIIELAKSLDLSVVAEGVETNDQAIYLCDRGVSYAQGWLYARPLPAVQLEATWNGQQAKNSTGPSKSEDSAAGERKASSLNETQVGARQPEGGKSR